VVYHRRSHSIIHSCVRRTCRAGRFDREISLGIPTEAARQQILKVLTKPLRLQVRGVNTPSAESTTHGSSCKCQLRGRHLGGAFNAWVLTDVTARTEYWNYAALSGVESTVSGESIYL
jgi:SpoVK/Ycf46/Vps4 family AAA+-type ATPase